MRGAKSCAPCFLHTSVLSKPSQSPYGIILCFWVGWAALGWESLLNPCLGLPLSWATQEERAEPEVLECVVCGDESAESHIGELEPDDATVVQLMARPSTDAIDVPQKCPPEDAIATMCLTIDQFKVVGPAEWSALVRAQYAQLGTQFRPDNITSRPVLRTDTEKWQLITSSRDLLMKLIDEACLRPFYDLLLYPGHRPGMKLALMCSRCPACLGESANKSENQYGHLKKSQKEIYSCPFGGRQLCSYAT